METHVEQVYDDAAKEFIKEMEQIEGKKGVKMLPIYSGENAKRKGRELNINKNIILKPVNFSDVKDFFNYFYDLFKALYLEKHQYFPEYSYPSEGHNIIINVFGVEREYSANFFNLKFSETDLKSWYPQIIPNIEKLAKEVHKLLKDFIL